MRKSIVLGVAIGAASLLVSTVAQATTGNWVGPTNSLWSSGGSWLDAIIPNAQGDVAQYGGTSSQIAKNDITDVMVGTLKVFGSSNISMQFTPNLNIVMNEDGAGPLRAQWLNDIQSTGSTANPALFINNPDAGNSGFFLLQDDLFISNTSNSTRTSGSIQVRGPIRGAGNIYIENVSNNIAAAQIAFTNNESSGPGAGGFAGDIYIRKGAVTMGRGDVFTPTSKMIYLGAEGQGDATLAFTGGGVGGMEYQFTVAANTGGTTRFIAASTGAGAAGDVVIRSTFTNFGNIFLNGPITFENRSSTGATLVVGDRIFGVAGFTKTGLGAMRLTNTNSFSGGATVNEGILVVAHTDTIVTPFGTHAASDGTLGTSTVTINSGTAVARPTQLQIDTLLASINVIANTATLSLAGGGNANSPDDGAADLGAGVNEVVGGLILGGVAQTTIGTYGSTASGATFQNDEYFSGTGKITLTPDFNVDSVIDAQDYVLWRKLGGDIGAYNNWVANFGNPAGAGTGGGLGNQAVPEPGTLLLAMTGVLLAWAGRRRR